MFGLGAPELLIVLAVVVVLFGGAKIPKLARSLGQAQKEFKTGLEEGHRDDVVTKNDVISKNDDATPNS